MNVTLPVVTTLPPLVRVTEAVRVTDWPTNDGFSDEVTAVVVATRTARVPSPVCVPVHAVPTPWTVKVVVPGGVVEALVVMVSVVV